MRKFRGRIIPESYEELCGMWESYRKENDIYPNSLICQKDFNLPAWSRVKDICGDNYEEFCSKFDLNNLFNKKDFNYYSEVFKDIAKELKRTPTVKDLRDNSDKIPSWTWLIKNCPDNSVKNYNDLVSFLGFKPYTKINKKFATKAILRKVAELDRNIVSDDFRKSDENSISTATISRIWGSFNNMLEDLGLPINQVGMGTLHKPIEELEEDIKKLCEYLHIKNGHKHISVENIDSTEWCMSYSTYNRYFLKELNMTVGEYIESLGYIPNKSGMGMVYKFNDGETTTSKFEYEFSKFLRKHNIKYIRNVLYKNFISNYEGNKDCDYLITYNNKEYYIEIAGMLRDAKSISHAKTLNLHKIQQGYLKDLNEKDFMLKDNNLNYIILFPYHLKDMDFLFDFLV